MRFKIRSSLRKSDQYNLCLFSFQTRKQIPYSLRRLSGSTANFSVIIFSRLQQKERMAGGCGIDHNNSITCFFNLFCKLTEYCDLLRTGRVKILFYIVYVIFTELILSCSAKNRFLILFQLNRLINS